MSSVWEVIVRKLRSLKRQELVEILRDLFLPIGGLKHELCTILIQHTQTIIKNQDKQAYEIVIRLIKEKISPRPLKENYDVLVYELTGKCSCQNAMLCSIHYAHLRTAHINLDQSAFADIQENVFTVPMDPEQQLSKLLKFHKQYQGKPEILEHLQRSILHWRCKLDEKKSKEAENDITLLNASRPNLLIDSPQEQSNKMAKRDDLIPIVTKHPNSNLLSSSCLKYPKHSSVIPVSSHLSSFEFKSQNSVLLQFQNPSFISSVTPMHKIFIYRQNIDLPSSKSPASKHHFLTCNGWSFHLGNTMINVTTVLDSPIEITQYIKTEVEPNILCKFKPSKDTLFRINHKDPPFFFQIVAAIESFNHWFVDFETERSLSYAAVFSNFLSSFSSKNNSNDDDLCVESREVSLRCPLTLCKLRNPVRGTACNHFQCFELDAFLDMYLNRPSRPCPICSTDIPLHELIVDKFIEEIVRDAPNDCISVVFDKTGKWTPIITEQESLTVEEFKLNSNEIIDLT